MKIGDEVYVHGYIDEIRNDTVIIRNAGGYFGTNPNEILSGIESWNGMLGQTIAPKGTFERIFNDEEDESRLSNDKQLQNKYLSIYRALCEIEKDINEDIKMINKGLKEKECFKPVIETDKLSTAIISLKMTIRGINKILDDIAREMY